MCTDFTFITNDVFWKYPTFSSTTKTDNFVLLRREKNGQARETAAIFFNIIRVHKKLKVAKC